jgi:predicted component of viral defense system (DUF524 family)
MQKRITEGVEVQRSSGNVLADLGLPDAEKFKIKTSLVTKIMKAMWSWSCPFRPDRLLFCQRSKK